MRSVLVLAAVALSAAVIVPRYVATHDLTEPGNTRNASALSARPLPPTPAVAAPASSRSVTVPRDAHGHFEVEARVEGRRMKFMVDTGASVIALTASDAARLSIHPASREFTAMVRTANGVVRAAPINLDVVEVDDLAVRDVAALVLPDSALSDNLLGLSFLSRLRRFEYAGGRLVLEQ